MAALRSSSWSLLVGVGIVWSGSSLGFYLGRPARLQRRRSALPLTIRLT